MPSSSIRNLRAWCGTRYGEFAGGLYDRPEVHLHIAEARGFVAGTDRRFDLIALPLLDSFAASAGRASLHASFVYTVEAIGTYLDHLKPGGYLAITRWLKLPPRDSLKLLLTAITALEARGVAEPGQPARADPRLGHHHAAGQERRARRRATSSRSGASRKSARSTLSTIPASARTRSIATTCCSSPPSTRVRRHCSVPIAKASSPATSSICGLRPTIDPTSSISSPGGPCRRSHRSRRSRARRCWTGAI